MTFVTRCPPSVLGARNEYANVGFRLFSDRLEVSRHSVDANRDAVDERERIQAFREHRGKHAPNAKTTEHPSCHALRTCIRAGAWRVFPPVRQEDTVGVRFREWSACQNLARNELKQVGWTKRLELAKVARRDRVRFDCATWLHKAREMPKEEFRREVERELTGKEEPHETIYFKVYKSQIPVIEQALETAALMLGSEKSRGYCLEMICADFLAGATLDNGNPEILLNSIRQLFKFLPGEQKQEFLTQVKHKA